MMDFPTDEAGSRRFIHDAMTLGQMFQLQPKQAINLLTDCDGSLVDAIIEGAKRIEEAKAGLFQKPTSLSQTKAPS